MKKTIALILGGGQGKRLFPLTLYRSKPAVPIGGKYRLIDIPISNCLHSGIKDIYVLTQFNSESLNNHINNTYRFDYFSRAFVRILAAEQTVNSANWFQGTADAVRKNIMHLGLRGDEEIIILSGDHLYEMDYRDFINFHRKNKADFTVSTIPIKKDETSEFGILHLDHDDRITGFREKPKTEHDLKGFAIAKNRAGFPKGMDTPCYLASMGVYIFNASTLLKVLKGDDADFGREVIPHSINDFRTFAYIYNGYWKDVGTIKAFYDVNIEMALGKPYFSAFYNGDVFTRPRFLPTARMSNARVESSLIAEGSLILDAEIRDSVVGLRSVIGKRCKIQRTVIMGADYYEDPRRNEFIKLGIGNGTIVQNAIVDKNARIGKNCVIKNLRNAKEFDGGNYYIRDGIVVIPKSAEIRDGTRI